MALSVPAAAETLDGILARNLAGARRRRQAARDQVAAPDRPLDVRRRRLHVEADVGGSIQTRAGNGSAPSSRSRASPRSARTTAPRRGPRRRSAGGAMPSTPPADDAAARPRPPTSTARSSTGATRATASTTSAPRTSTARPRTSCASRRKDGDVEYRYLDPDAVPRDPRHDRETRVRGVEQISETDLGDYEQVAGVWIPFSHRVGPQGRAAQRPHHDRARRGQRRRSTTPLFRFPPAGTQRRRAPSWPTPAPADAAGARAAAGAPRRRPPVARRRRRSPGSARATSARRR